MAAPSNKQSPSNQKMHESGAPSLKDPPPASVPPAAAAAASATPSPPSYTKSETCESYILAKQLLNNDNFEEALTIIEEELIRTTGEIRVSLGLTDTTNSDLETEIELHEALAPLHYLYGTTLLYSLEEAKGDGNDNGAMMTEAGAVAATTATPAAVDPNNPWAHLSAPAEASSNSNDSNDNSNAPNNNSSEDAAATAEDIQIAWENLEAARMIVEKMLLQATTVTNLSELQVAKLQLDLAQIHLREGDLQRINGNYTSAVGDYSSCLEILLRHNNTKDEHDNLRDLNRKIADTQFNLGLTYLTSSSDLQKEVAGANASASETPNEASAAPTADQREKAAILAREHCEKGIQQHVDCARTFCGIVAKLCGVDPETILKLSENGTDAETAASAKKPAAGFKTTGLDDENEKPASSTTADASQTLNVWRMALAKMIVSNSPSDPQDSLRVSDILQVLDEIQETIDEAERSQEGVLQAAEIRVKAQQAAAAMDGDEVANADGSTTTIGFGQAAASVAAAATVNATQATSKPAAAADAKPMMVVKKKKKRKDIAADTEEGEAKKPKTA